MCEEIEILRAEEKWITARSGTGVTDAAEARKDERWYVVHVQPHAENRAIARLEQQGFQVFCPRVRRTVRHARKALQVLSPLFPGYLFLRLDMSRDRWRSVNGTRGVIRIITHGDLPCPVSPGIVETLREQTDEIGAMNWRPSLKVGQSVRVCIGPFADLVGTLQQLNSSGRIRVLFDLLGRCVSVAMPCEAVEPSI